MDFLVDECVLGKTENLLKELGFSTISILELGKTSASNGEVLTLAKQRKAILVTSDLHFANLPLHPLGTHLGIIVLRLRTAETSAEIDKVHAILTRLLQETSLFSLKGKLAIVDGNKYRIHKE